MRENLKIIKSLKDVHAVASKMFPCGAKKIDEIHGKGYMGVKLIVGEKMNPIYDPNADPKAAGLTPELRKMEEEKSKLAVPDIRILWIAPGTTVKDLVKGELKNIKMSLEQRDPIIDEKVTTISKNETSDADIAAQISKGDRPKPDFDEEEDDEIGFSDDTKKDWSNLDDEDVPAANQDEIVGAIKMIGQNMEALANSISAINDRINKIEESK